MTKTVKKPVTLLLLFVVCLTTACDNSAFREQIGEFQKAMNDSRSGVEAYYQEMNSFEMDLYLLSRELDPNQTLSFLYGPLNPDEKKPAADPRAGYINGPFSPNAIQARLDSLKLIGLYGTRLAELAGTSAPAEFESAASALGANVVNLEATFNKLRDSGDPTAFRYAKPVSELVGIVGRLFIERKRDKDLVEAIRKATPEITKITTQLSMDLEDVISPIRRTGLEQSIALLTNYYNDEIKKPSTRESRKNLLTEVKGMIRQYELLTTAKPQEAVKTMEEANQALLAYANSGRNDTDFTHLVGKIGEFRDRATQIAKAIQEIREIRKGLRDAN